MKTKTLLLAAAIAAVSLPALAADLRPRVVTAAPAPVLVSSWEGWNAVVFGGYGQSNEKTTITGNEPIAAALVGMQFVPPSQDPRPDGGFFGGEVGYNWHSRAFVFGIAADARWSNINGSAQHAPNLNALIPGIGLTTDTNAELNWMVSVVGRFGVLLTDRLLLSVKGGVAFADIERTTTIALRTPIPALNATATSTSSDTSTGWIVGADLRAALADAWFIGVGYEYASFGSNDRTAATRVVNTPVSFNIHEKDAFHFARLEVGRRF